MLNKAKHGVFAGAETRFVRQDEMPACPNVAKSLKLSTKQIGFDYKDETAHR